MNKLIAIFLLTMSLSCSHTNKKAEQPILKKKASVEAVEPAPTYFECGAGWSSID